MSNSSDNIQNQYFDQNLIFQSAHVTLKIRSRSTKLSYQPFPVLPSMYLCKFGKKIHPLVQKITHGNYILDISKCLCDLENKVKVIKIKQNLSLFPTMYLCKFGQNPATSSEDNGNYILGISKWHCGLEN